MAALQIKNTILGHLVGPTLVEATLSHMRCVPSQHLAERVEALATSTDWTARGGQKNKGV